MQHNVNEQASRAPKKDPRSTESQLGVAYRQLGNFLNKHDPAREWGGLSCVQTEVGDGRSDWFRLSEYGCSSKKGKLDEPGALDDEGFCEQGSMNFLHKSCGQSMCAGRYG
eukprot:scaffold282713_cov24-Tisochrysis_lutea.AAC.2